MKLLLLLSKIFLLFIVDISYHSINSVGEFPQRYIVTLEGRCRIDLSEGINTGTHCRYLEVNESQHIKIRQLRIDC